MKKKTIIICSMILVVVLLLVSCLVLGRHSQKSKSKDDKKVVSVITIDVNPSIEIGLNKDNVVVDVKALNDDSDKLLENENFENMKLEESLAVIIGLLKDNNYLSDDSNLILINVDSEDDELSDLVKDLVTKVSEEKSVSIEVVMQEVEVTEELKELAEQNNITVSKAYFIQEQIKAEEGLKIEDLKDVSINEIKTKISTYKEPQQTPEIETPKNGGTTRTGSIEKCQHITEVITREEAIDIAVKARGGVYNPGGYCDIRSVDAYGSLSPDGVCAIMVNYNYKQQNCTYYVSSETGQIVGSPSCKHVDTSINDSQCIIMRDIGVSAREQISIKTEEQTATEIVSTVEDNKGDLYEYHISKQNGSIVSKTLIKAAEPVYAE